MFLHFHSKSVNFRPVAADLRIDEITRRRPWERRGKCLDHRFLEYDDGFLGLVLRDLGQQLVVNLRDQYARHPLVNRDDGPHRAVGACALNGGVAGERVPDAGGLPGGFDDASSADDDAAFALTVVRVLPHPLSEDAVLGEEPVAYGGGLILGQLNAVVGPSRGDQARGAAAEDEAEVGGFGGGTLLLGYVLDGDAGDGCGRQLVHI